MVLSFRGAIATRNLQSSWACAKLQIPRSARDDNSHTFLFDTHTSVLPRPWRNQPRVNRLKLKLRLIRIGRERCLRRFHPVLVVALGEVRLVVRAARLVAHG